ncbi:hypothetical protein K1X45_05680 [Pseudochrobactrum sp. Wa41.01b-1]|uniref:hypothetical protein n=1 Tax=Pseudochrobactrum sp. Wa41.01b-1 TaxID=2864102 RepID=UPI001C6885F9|nr:hypothetical protein [Pseudochrobactrum sp. Wa41.01b-1]QYM73897.1 hypothetical protein K1X45_05680 [Pseudochrobactrum sp. Wa41.01b-1]
MAKGRLDSTMDQLGVKLVPTYRRRARGQSHARGTMKAIRDAHGEGHLIFVVRTIKQSAGNIDELWSETIGAVSDIVLQRPDWAERRAGDFMAAFDKVDLASLRGRALALRPWPVRGTLRTLILSELERLLVPACTA